MLNVIQYLVSEDSYGEKQVMEARNKIRAQLDRIAMSAFTPQATSYDPSIGMPVNEEAEIRQKHNLPDNVKLLPPLPPPMVPQDGPVPFPGLDPPVG